MAWNGLKSGFKLIGTTSGVVGAVVWGTNNYFKEELGYPLVKQWHRTYLYGEPINFKKEVHHVMFIGPLDLDSPSKHQIKGVFETPEETYKKIQDEAALMSMGEAKVDSRDEVLF